jgi:glycosyltransferase involved in cell wall biosynthesis
MPPAVSVIIPTYNRSALLRKTIQSVLSQTFQDYEIIVVNNSSTDDSVEMIRSLKDPRIRVFEISNGGVIAKSRNLGLRNAQGKYIAFLDDDDMWVPEKLEKQAAYLDKHPEYQMVYSEVWRIDENDVRKELMPINRKTKEGDLSEELLKGNFIPQLTVMIRRELLETVGFLNEDPGLRTIEDYEYWLRVGLMYKIGFINEPLGLYRVHSSGMSKSVAEAMLTQKVLGGVIKRDPNTPYKEKINDMVHRLYIKTAVYNWRTGSKKGAREDIGRYVRWSLKNRNPVNILKAGVLYALLVTGLYKPFLQEKKHFRRFV